jgi:hypothetical protein
MIHRLATVATMTVGTAVGSHGRGGRGLRLHLVDVRNPDELYRNPDTSGVA